MSNPAVRDIFLIGLYTGMHRSEVVSLRWEGIDLGRRILRVDETKTGVPLELPVTRQLAAILERLRPDCGGQAAPSEGWLFPSPKKAKSGHVADIARFYEDIGDVAGTRFWFHGLRNAFITVAERELMLPRSLTKRLVNHARPSDVTEGYAADWTVDQLRESAQRVVDPASKLAAARALDLETASTSLGAVLGLGPVTGNEMLDMLDWLLERQPWIERSLANRHLKGGNTLILHDVSTT